ncbi:DNA-directed RNA polymerase [Powellomyces hirtus]|uniref:DNA-directed RNA polymerase n=1 Tax=Powellomyces hirtus TaxID=109895 RepID=A0A507E411_9FUNG|nr:DNA-directed RNA polymerase [Powellomyces hirtus]
MQTLVDNCQTYPGANRLVKGKTNQRIDLRSARTKPQLEVGDQVERHMIDGDLVLFNRQPSLHKMSMMAHRARVMPYSTFRMNGNEMNLHMPQTYEARAEMEALMTVSRLLVSSQASKPVNALVQDGLYGVRKFTKRDTFN